MPVAHRLTIRSAGHDPRQTGITAAAATYGVDLGDGPEISDIVFVDGELGEGERKLLGDFLVDPHLEIGTWESPSADELGYEVALHPGVTDAAAAAVVTAAGHLGIRVDAAATGRRVVFAPGVARAVAEQVVESIVANPVIERWAAGTITPVFHPGSAATDAVQRVPLAGLDADALAALNRERGLALDPAELVVIQKHFVDAGRDPTDAELETLAQTWSEHCAHKTFRADITVDGVARAESLLAQLRRCTDDIDAPFVRSSFVGNAGIVSFGDGLALSLKAETHNHPSAIEPFGGANTGVGGVIRDIIGAGHRPIAVTDVLCFGPADTAGGELPAGVLHPQLVADGVIAGVADYGNKIGLPTIAGAVLYDHRYATNPLVFCGCIGAAADGPAPTGPHVGDRILVIGGATGRDGIRGATFSSLDIDATTGEVAGASVQIGDPITEKLVADVLHHLGAAGVNHRPLWTAITDCGAGGLSSAIGEMAEVLGADVELGDVPLKYPGLEPWEVWLSEAQERMVIAADPADVATVVEACVRFGVGVTDVGHFTGDGVLRVGHHGTTIVDLPTAFLHDGRPTRQLTATAPRPVRDRADDATETELRAAPPDVAATLLALLAHPNIASKADVVRRYDHEIGGSTVVRPLVGDHQRGHADGVVLANPVVIDGLVRADPGATTGIAVGIGVNPWHGIVDAEAMAAVAVDEAIRNVVAVGADPDQVALLDNFSWGDPRDPAVLGELVAAVDGCCAAARAFAAPFVSGKDSLNNTYTDRDGERRAIPPTLVITAVAHVPDVDAAVTAELTSPGNVVVLVGATGRHLAGSHLDLVTGAASGGPAAQFDPGAPERYRRLHAAIGDGTVRSCHDVSEGGLAAALAELCINSGLGITVADAAHPDPTTAWFSESTGRLVVEVDPDAAEALVASFDAATVLGTVTAEPVLDLLGTPIAVAELAAAFGATEASSS